MKENLTVRETEKLVREGVISKNPSTKKRTERLVAELEVEEILGEQLSTRVAVAIGKRKGKIVIEFAGEEDLARILEIISK